MVLIEPAIIIDANCFSDTNLRSEIRNKIKAKKIKVILDSGGPLEKELKQANINLYRLYALGGRFYKICKKSVEKKTAHLESLNLLSSNDHHIIAVAIISGANILVTEDLELKKDFKNCDDVDKKSNCLKRQHPPKKRSIIGVATPIEKTVNFLLNNAVSKYTECECMVN